MEDTEAKRISLRNPEDRNLYKGVHFLIMFFLTCLDVLSAPVCGQGQCHTLIMICYSEVELPYLDMESILKVVFEKAVILVKFIPPPPIDGIPCQYEGQLLILSLCARGISQLFKNVMVYTLWEIIIPCLLLVCFDDAMLGYILHIL